MSGTRKKKKMSFVIRNHNKIISSLLELDNMVFIDLMSSLYTDKFLKEDFEGFLNMERMTDKNYIEFLSVLASTIQESKRSSKEILDKIILRNNRYLKGMHYLDLDFPELTDLINKDMVPSMHGQGVTAEMILLYRFSVGIFNGEEIDLIKQVYLDHVEKAKSVQSQDLLIELNGPLSGSLMETEFRCFVNETSIQNLDESKFLEIQSRWACNYQPHGKFFNNVPRGLLLFFFQKFSELLDDKAHARSVIRSILQNVYRINLFAKRQQYLISERLNLKEENWKLLRKIRRLQSELETFNKPRDESSSNKVSEDTEDTIIKRLNKENYHLKVRIEDLELRVAELEEEKRVNKEIQENIEIEEEKVIEFKKSDVTEYFTIVISGGHWNSRKRDEVTEAFQENKVIFIPADRTLRNIDTIRNADLVIFDTSFHAHAYYNLIKKEAFKFMHIKRSSLDEFKTLFASLN